MMRIYSHTNGRSQIAPCPPSKSGDLATLCLEILLDLGWCWLQLMVSPFRSPFLLSLMLSPSNFVIVRFPTKANPFVWMIRWKVFSLLKKSIPRWPQPMDRLYQQINPIFFFFFFCFNYNVMQDPSNTRHNHKIINMHHKDRLGNNDRIEYPNDPGSADSLITQYIYICISS